MKLFTDIEAMQWYKSREKSSAAGASSITTNSDSDKSQVAATRNWSWTKRERSELNSLVYSSDPLLCFQSQNKSTFHKDHNSSKVQEIV